MKLQEILITDTSKSSFEVTPEFANILSKIDRNGEKVLELTSTLHISKLGYFYGLIKNNSCVGWIELSDSKNIAGKVYKTIKFIFMTPEVRNTFAVGAFLIGLRRLLKNPIILGSDKFGGVLFSDGVKLVKALSKSAIADVKILDLNTGEIVDLEDKHLQNPASKGITLVFEDDDFPLTHSFTGGSIFILENCEKTNYD